MKFIAKESKCKKREKIYNVWKTRIYFSKNLIKEKQYIPGDLNDFSYKMYKWRSLFSLLLTSQTFHATIVNSSSYFSKVNCHRNFQRFAMHKAKMSKTKPDP